MVRRKRAKRYSSPGGFLLVRGYNRLREQQESVPATPTDQECPFCRFTIPLGASRCAHCTSELPAAGPA